MEPTIPWYQSAVIRQQIVQLIIAGLGLFGIATDIDWSKTVEAVFAAIAALVAVWTVITRLTKPHPNLTAAAANKEQDLRDRGVLPTKQSGFARLTLMAILAFGSVAVVPLVSGCSTLGVPSPQTFNEKHAAALSTVTSIRNTARTLLEAGKISVADAQNVQDQADTARQAIDIAATIHSQDPTSGGNRLTAIINGLTAIQTYLATKGR